MALLTKYYDYELKEEAYKLTGEKGYVRDTTTLLELVSVSDTTMDYCTATFKVNVVNDRANSQVVFYDNDNLISFYSNSTEYTYLEWSNQITSEVTISIRLSYDVQHTIQAKYLANTRCTQSKSRVVKIIEPKPSTSQTTLSVAMSVTNRQYAYNANPVANATLTIVDDSQYPTANQSQTIKFYLDGVYAGTATTNSSGVASYTFNGTERGKHTVTAVYDGSEYLFHSEGMQEFSKGYLVEIIDYPTSVLNDGDITVTAQLTSFIGNAMASKTLSFAKSNNTTISNTSATTDSEGKATLTMGSDKYLSIGTLSNNVYSVPYRVKFSTGDASDLITTKDGKDMLIELNDVDYVTATNQSVSVTGAVSPTRDGVFPTDVTILANGQTAKVKTNNNGAFSYLYNGAGAGDITLTASINGDTDTVEIEDLLQYWRANNVSWNKTYKQIVGEFRELTNGFKLEFPKDLISGGVSLGIGDGTSFGDFELSFTIVGHSGITGLGVNYWSKRAIADSGYVPTDISVEVGDVIKAVSEDGVMTVYKNNVSISTTTAQNLYPCIWIEGNQKGTYLLFDNLKLKVV